MPSLDPPDGRIHLRTHPDNATAKPAECGKTGQATFADIPTNPDDLAETCKECIQVRREKWSGISGLAASARAKEQP